MLLPFTLFTRWRRKLGSAAMAAMHSARATIDRRDMVLEGLGCCFCFGFYPSPANQACKERLMRILRGEVEEEEGTSMEAM